MAKVKAVDLTVYFDLDNTLAQFSTRENEEEQIKKMYQEGFYRDLPVLPGASEVVGVTREIGCKVKILSGLIDSPYVKSEKIEWCKEKLDIDEEDCIFLPFEGSKAGIIGNLTKNDILVDDYQRYIDEWVALGGEGYLLVRKQVRVPGYKCLFCIIDFLKVLDSKVEMDYKTRSDLLVSCSKLSKFYNIRQG